ncbi:enoyl-CoA hydratase [Oceanicola granulosus HTCC2516]|uniref:Enoyl-CoA hydratase n=1 Tax=Oceanicola granulosus (strain ATCC BAA-861 / DSM 15982 / KCTC 12143 / HTCC2516) TaxID=314256 RepID=Q2CHC0_OCEGH|nr:enoyl-CoA hydratase/isomerase family protein [Oceanicola granulosus]EAR52119.1 enoyl-CoA hydratase [Oceanicola granulosus HTCC2516]
MSAGAVHLEIEGAVARITFDRPAARNAMTWEMYDALSQHCDTLADAPGIRCAVLRGAGGASFVAGSDIAQFAEFEGGADGIAYEQKMDRILQALAAIPCPTLAVIEGLAVGGGLNIAAACDLRIATPDSRFGVPIARTLGNCLSMRNAARLSAMVGGSHARRMLLLGELLTVDDLAGTGFLTRVAAPEELDHVVARLTDKLCSNAPLTLRTSKEALARIEAVAPPDGRDLIATCYDSDDFREGIAAFTEKRTPAWRGK